MSSCTSCSTAAQAYQSASPQSYLKQQFADLQKPAQDAPGQQPLNSSGRGQVVNVTA